MKHTPTSAGLAALHVLAIGALTGCQQPSAPGEAVPRDSTTAIKDSSAAPVAAAQPDCSTPPALVGVPTGRGAFSLQDGFSRGEQRTFAFGDVVLRDANEGGSSAVMIWGHNACGLWIRRSNGNSYIGMEPYTFDPGRYEALKPTPSGGYVLTDGFATELLSLYVSPPEEPNDLVDVTAVRTYEPRFTEGD